MRADKMIFVVGNSRSGTTMLGRILGLNSRVHTFGELHFFEQLVGIEEFASDKSWPRDKAITVMEQLITRARDGFFAPFLPGIYERDAEAIIDRASSLKPIDLYARFMVHEAGRAGKQVPCEQTPRYLFSVNEILKIYPNARVINIIRDPRDVIISQRSKWKRRFLGARGIPMREAVRAWCNYHPWLVSRLWVSCVDYADAIKDDRFTSIRFEDLVSEPNDQVKMLCDFLDVPFEIEMLKAPQVGSSSGQDSRSKTGINKDRAGGWQRHGMQRSIRLLCEWACGTRMTAHGYTSFLNEGKFSPLMVFSMMMLPIKLPLMFLFNVKRFPHIASSIRRRLSKQRKTI